MINRFEHPYGFLSNFYPVEVTYCNLKFQSIEAAFQAAKATDITIMKHFVGLKPNEAKYLGRRIKLREDWHIARLKIMESLLRQKFNYPELAKLLIETGDEELIEGNYWHDTFWGIDLKTGKGENHLGKLLMKIREELK